MYIMYMNINVINPVVEVISFYNVNSGLTVLVDGSWSIGDL